MNDAILCGKISAAKPDHVVGDEMIYSAIITTKRLSNTEDKILVLMPERLIPEQSNVTLLGEFRSHNTADRHLKLYFYVKDIVYEEMYSGITLEGYVCKKPQMRITPGGRKITDILLAVNRENVFDRSDYIPVVAWGSDAKKAAELNIGSKIRVEGRIQSREHRKGIAYEVSINKGGLKVK